MTADEIVAKLEPWRARHRRLAWDPVVAPGDGQTASKFGGTAWTGPAAPWPACGECGKRMPLFLQLDLAALPGELGGRFGDGLLQLFYCTADTCDGGYETFGRQSCARVVRPDGESAAAPAGVDGGFPGSVVTGWERFEDLPSPEEHGDLGVEYTYSGPDGTRVVCVELDLVADGVRDDGLAEAIGAARDGDKLAGWPDWVQGAEYPSCPRCEKRMELVFQFDSEDNVPFMFGDVGIGHVTQCPEHKDVVAFGWACG